MSWHEQPGNAPGQTPKCCRCGDSGRVWSCRQGDWVDCPDCRPVMMTDWRVPIVASPPHDR